MKISTTPSHTNAFSLLELSIVLVIIGLLVGGVLSGQSLIRSAELRTVSSEYTRFTTAIGAFRDKYFALPGDMSNATSFWTTGTGNGDGDGLIENHGTLTSNEISTFWVDLAFAGLIEGSYTNLGGTALTGGTHVPRAKLNNANWDVAQIGTVSIAGVSTPGAGVTAPNVATFFAGTYGNVFLFGSGTDALLPVGVLKADEAWNIDTKLDDARPDTGSVLTLESQGVTAGTGCSSITGALTALAASSYSLSNPAGSVCSLVFKTGY